ncbi:MFS transporter [Leptolyngbya sp. AN02str]|uniref:MFS transporter n=1 Tax=Leptolyngbya sp. AN02str TaxID=3423363 RepID=UPI003D323974
MTLLVVSTLTVMAGATIAPSLPAMQFHFANIPNSPYLVRLILTIPALSIAIGAPFLGVVSDRLGRKPLLLASLLLYGLAGSSGTWLNSIGLILVGRALLGISVAGVMITTIALIADYYSGDERGQFLGLQSAFMALGGVFFLAVGGFLADFYWRMPFLIYLTAWGLVPFVLFLLPEPQNSDAATDATVITLDEPQTLPTQLLWLTYAIALASQIVFYIIPTQLPFYLQQLANTSASQSGLAIALATFSAAISSLSYQRIKSGQTFIGMYALSFINMAVGYIIIALAQGLVTALLGLAIAGLGLGLLMPNMNFCLTSIVPSAVRGRVLSGLTTSFFLGQFLSPLVSQPLSQLTSLGATYGFAGAFMALLGAIALLVWWNGNQSS